MDRDGQTLCGWPYLEGKHFRPFLPEIGPRNSAPDKRPQGRRGPRPSELGSKMSNPDERPPGRRGPRSSDKFTEDFDGKITDPSCKSPRTKAKAESSVLPSISCLPNLVRRPVRVVKGKSQPQWPVTVLKSMPDLQPTCLPIIPRAGPRKIGTVVVDKNVTSYHLSNESTLLARRASLAKGLNKKADTTGVHFKY